MAGFDAWGDLLRHSFFLHSALNSFLVATVVVAGSLVLCPLAGYAFAKHCFPGRDFLFGVVLTSLMVPGIAVTIPSFLLFCDLGWVNNWLPLIVPSLGGAIGVFLSRQFIRKLPDSLLEAARAEGMNEWLVFIRVVMPLSKPLLITLAIVSFLGSWNSFLSPLVVLVDPQKFTLPVFMTTLQDRFPGREDVQLAAAVLSIAPVLVVFFIFQKPILKSLTNAVDTVLPDSFIK